MTTIIQEVVAAYGSPPPPKVLAAQPHLNPRWAVGDLLAKADMDLLAKAAEALGIKRDAVRDMVETAKMWPDHSTRVASWRTHFVLRKHPRRFKLVRPGMSEREARRLLGNRKVSTISPAEEADRVERYLSHPDTVAELRRRERVSRETARLARAAEAEQRAQLADAERLAKLERQGRTAAKVVFDWYHRSLRAALELEGIVQLIQSDANTENVAVYTASPRKFDELKRVMQRLGDAGYDGVEAIEALEKKARGHRNRLDPNAIDVEAVERGPMPELMPGIPVVDDAVDQDPVDQDPVDEGREE